MNKFKYIPIIENIADYSNWAAWILKEEFFQSLDNGLPYGYIDFNDPEGDFLAKFNCLQIGASVDLEPCLTDRNSSEDIKKITDWIVLRVVTFDTQGKRRNRRNTTVRLYVGHKLFLYKDQSNHCYPKMNANELISQVLANQDRGCAFDLVYYDIPDNEKSIRYKCLESDWEFLKNKVVAYSSFKKTPLYLYSDLENKFYFKSIASMYSEKPDAGLYIEPAVGSKIEVEACEKWLKSSSLKWHDVILGYRFDIGDKEAVAESVRLFSFYDTDSTLSYRGIKENSVKIEDGSSLSKVQPLSMIYARANKFGSKIFSIKNHGLGDIYGLMNASQRNYDKMFKLYIDTYFNDNFTKIGMPISVFIKKNHWANGLWILTSSGIEIDKSGMAKSILELSRASFSGSRSETTLENPEVMFSV